MAGLGFEFNIGTTLVPPRLFRPGAQLQQRRVSIRVLNPGPNLRREIVYRGPGSRQTEVPAGHCNGTAELSRGMFRQFYKMKGSGKMSAETVINRNTDHF